MMRSSESGFIRNPTLAAMAGSAAVHGVLVMVAVLNPADSKTSNPLRIISLTPPTQNPGFIKPGSTLQVPNVQPPVNLGNAPGTSQIPDISQFKTVPSPSVYLGGTNIPSISMRGLQARNIPQPSIQNPGVPNISGFGFPTAGNPGGTAPPGFNPPPHSVPNGQEPKEPQTERFQSSPNTTPSKPDYRGYEVAKNPDLPAVASENFRNSDPANFPYAQLSPPRSPTSALGVPPNTPPQTTATALPPLKREELKTFGAKMSKRVGQKLSFQRGVSLTAAYPKEACASQKSDSAIIAAAFGPDGSLVSGADSITVARSASSPVMNQAAIAAVQGYRAPAAQGYQLFNFTVDIPYSETVCKAANPEPSDSPPPSPAPTPSSSPSAKPPIGPSPEPTPSSQPIQPSSPNLPATQEPPTSAPQAQPTALPSPSVQPEPSPEPSATEPPPSPSPVPSESPSAPAPTDEPSNSKDESLQMEPLPTPSVSVPDEAKP